MPFKDKKLGWAGQVKRVVKGPGLARLTELPYWKQAGEESYRYRKLKRGFKTKTAAADWEKSHWAKIEQTQVYPPKKKTPLTFSKASTPYLKQVKTRCKSYNTFRYKKATVYNLLKFWGQDFPMPIKTLEIEEYLDQLYEAQGGKKANRELRELKTLFNWLLKRKIINDNPITPIEDYEEKDFEKYVPPKEDIFAAYNIANAFEKDLIKMFYHSLARSIEVRRLKKTDCDFVNRQVWFSTRKRRGGQMDRTHLDMNRSLYELLYRRCQVVEGEYVFPGPNGGMLPKSTLDNIMPRLIKSLNFEKNEKGVWEPKPEDEQILPFGFHSIRHHTAAHLYLNKGYSQARMQKILRHKRASTTDTYLKSITKVEMIGGLDALDDDNFETPNTDLNPKDGGLVGFPEAK